jgi:alpha-N-arabinofuranosidase
MKSIKRAVLGLSMLAATAAAAPQVAVTIDAVHPGAVINKDLYGQSIGLGGGGMWVGPGSPIANIRGWRKDMVDALKALHVPVMRWPGGCAADAYHWRDGIGVHGDAVGTHEFFDLAEQVGADAHVVANVGTGSPREAADWIEYMTADGDSTLAQLRAKNGHPRPFKVAYVGVGNESWGCGGDMKADYYADLYNQYAVFIKARSGTPPRLVASGGDPAWTAEVGKKERIRDYRDAIAIHDAGTGAVDGADAVIAQHIAALDGDDPARKVQLVVDEWRTRPDGGAGRRPDAMGDALAAALRFHVFHARAGRLAMASMAPTDHALIVATGDGIVLTPTYHAFRMHVPFQGAAALPVRVERDARAAAAAPAVSASAARAPDGILYLSLVNPDPDAAMDVVVGVTGAETRGARGSVLAVPATDAHQALAAQASAAPVPFAARAAHGKLRLTLPPKSVAVVAIRETPAPARAP